jgi:hypothetical protein
MNHTQTNTLIPYIPYIHNINIHTIVWRTLRASATPTATSTTAFKPGVETPAKFIKILIAYSSVSSKNSKMVGKP